MSPEGVSPKKVRTIRLNFQQLISIVGSHLLDTVEKVLISAKATCLYAIEWPIMAQMLSEM